VKQHLLKIDFLRGIAILLVFVYHCQEVMFPGYLGSYNANGIINTSGTKSIVLNFSPTAFGWAGVVLFFVISGFLIHLGYLKNQENFDVRMFYSKRFWRIFPPYWLSLVFIGFSTGSLWYYLFSKQGFTDFFLHLVTLHNFTDRTFFSINKSYWSLAVEVQLYLIYPFLLLMRRKIGMRASFAATLILSILLILLGLFFNNFGTVFTYAKSVFELWFIWAAGAYFAELYFNGKTILKRGGLPAFLVCVLLLTISKYYIYFDYFEYHIATLAFILFIDWFLQADNVTMNSHFSKSMIAVGLCSYSIYLIHQPYLNNLLHFFDIISQKHAVRLLNVIPAFIVVFLISWALYQFVELPSVALGKKLRDRLK